MAKAAPAGPEGPLEGGGPAAPVSRDVLDAVDAGLVVLDARGRILMVNDALCALTGRAPEDLTGQAPPHAFWPAPDDLRWREGLRAVLDSGRCGFDAEVTGAGGARVAVNVRGRGVRRSADGARAVLLVTGLAGWSARESALRDRARAFETLVQHAPDIITRVDRDLRHTFVNRATVEMTGIPAERWIGRTVEELGFPEHLIAFWNRELRACLETGRPRDIEFELPRPEGPRFLAGRLVPETGPGGDPESVLIISRDLTARRRLEEWLTAERAEHRRLARREAALRRVAETVARGDDPPVVFDVAAEESARLLRADAGWVVATDRSPPRVMGAWVAGNLAAPHSLSLATLLEGEGALARAMRSGMPARVDDYAALPGPGPRAAMRAGLRSGVAAPVVAAGTLWGLLVVARTEPGIEPGAEEVLGRFGELVGTALANSRAAQELDRLARTDALTGLPNRRGFFERFAEEVHRARRHADQLSLVIVDIDHFKRVNDAHGHQAGDEALREVAHRLHAVIRRDEVVARIGGEEFAWLLPRADLDLARAAAERARASVSDPPLPGIGVLTVSAGVARLRPGDDVESLLRRADDALYRAKDAGRDRVEDETPAPD